MTAPRASTPGLSQPGCRIVLLGRPCDNTTAAANVLNNAGIALAARIVADPYSAVAQNPEQGEGSPVWRAKSPREARKILERLRPDLAIAACYPWRLSHRARATVRCGVLNIHPSLLPQGRGPDPVFWVYRNGDRETGVSLHVMDDGLDSGPILAQRRVPVPEAMDAVTLERQLFEIGASMTAGLLPDVLSGNVVSFPQDERAATYQAAPSALDWIISPLLPAAWAWRFTQGVAALSGPLVVQSRGTLVPVRRAIAWGEHGVPPDGLPPGVLPVQFRPGWVLFE